MASLGASLVAISPQQAKFSKPLAKKLGITFPILSDPQNRVASEFGLLYRLPPQLKAIYMDFGIDLSRFNGDDAWELPVPARFILDTHGVVVSAEANPDYTKRPDPREIISAISPDE
ncbi:AhpC/TSA family protein [Desulfoluna spongiiphila]|uniref:AhpC/TSA family protein n=2 Tax=Desulfoluna spongiiphila TaxID=419481 RepID=A0A1G5AE29_9BACT|nr:AhpC/TSA family protein [Desulfoluna spongiiphila]VVS90680.1 alkyl hydroperoxide reductase subunit c/ thiol specific antioxidant [Desulfoluna spongiiphila]